MPKHYQLDISTYYGGKGAEGTYQKIINQIPPHKIRVIGCAGLCSVTRNMEPSDITFLIDKDQQLIQGWRNAKKLSNKPGTIVPICDDFMNWGNRVGELSQSNDVFVYLDPPYPLSSRKCSREIYQHEMSDDDHRKLLAIACSFSCPTAISTYPNSIYSEILTDWRLLEFQSSTRHGLATEHLYMNYPEPIELHDYSYLGDDFRQREQIKKKHRSLVRKVSDLTPKEFAMLQKNIPRNLSTTKKRF